MNIGEKIGIYTKQANISIRQLALEADLNYNTLYAFVKRGGKKLPDEQIVKIAKVLGISENTLKNGDEIEEARTEAEILLNTTINAIVGESSGKEREDKIYLINSFLEANSSLIKNIYRKLEDKRN